MMQPQSSAAALERYFLEARAKLLDVAAILDRIDRGGEKLKDQRLERMQKALAILTDANADKAKRIQEAFSLAYEPEWRRG